jgi:hypothetical protein
MLGQESLSGKLGACTIVCRCSTVEQIAGVSRRTFFRYYEAKEDVMVERSDRFGEMLLAELAKRP